MTKDSERLAPSNRQLHERSRPKRNIRAFCHKLWDDMENMDPLDAADLRIKRLAELTPDELHEYDVIASVGSGRSTDISISS